MHNAQLLGVRQVDRVDLRLSFIVVAGFAVVTIISYVNELSRAGLLDRHRRRHLYIPYQDAHSSRHRMERSVEYDSPHDDALIQKNGQVHQLGLEIHNIKKVLGSNNGGNPEQEINIAVHLGRNSSYFTANNSVRVYHFNNTMRNFYTTLKVPSLPIHDNSEKELKEIRVTLKTWLNAVNTTKQAYRNATAVLVYQHDPGGYFTRDCLRSLVHDHHLTAPTNPLNTQYRREWEMMPKFKRNTFKVLYGGLSFGVCEGIGHPCTYMLMVKHPLDRILTVYNICQKNTSNTLCHFNKLNVQNMTLQQFIKVQGSSFFRKLLYYSKHCRLVGEDEICLPDTKTSFVLTVQERHIYLKNILENLENWFSVIGLEEHFNESLQLFEGVFGLDYTGCSRPTKLRELMRMDKHLWPLLSGAGRETLRGFSNMSEFTLSQNVTYKAIREKLVQDPQVLKWLSADMAIYDKLEELFKKQLEIFNVTASVIKNMKNPNLPISVAPQLRKFSKKHRNQIHTKLKHKHVREINRSIHSIKKNNYQNLSDYKQRNNWETEHNGNSLKHFASHKNKHGGALKNLRKNTLHWTSGLPAELFVTTLQPKHQSNELTFKPYLNGDRALHKGRARNHKHHEKYPLRKSQDNPKARAPEIEEDLVKTIKTSYEKINQKVANPHTMQPQDNEMKISPDSKHRNKTKLDNKIGNNTKLDNKIGNNIKLHNKIGAGRKHLNHGNHDSKKVAGKNQHHADKISVVGEHPYNVNDNNNKNDHKANNHNHRKQRDILKQSANESEN